MSEFINQSELEYFRGILPNFDENFVEPTVKEDEIYTSGKTFVEELVNYNDVRILGAGCKHSKLNHLLALAAIKSSTDEIKLIISCAMIHGNQCVLPQGEECKIAKNHPNMKVTFDLFEILEEAKK